ncbi:hypothetical protein ACFWPV_01055 [Streptomyces uncialis]|uniref:hypothetical protein n=1 Tax=Streptomyces uncialis TaxID=1048205 RepID=UPI003650F804
MHRNSLVLRLLRRACGVIVALGAVNAALLLLTADPDALLITYRRGGLTPLITFFAAACACWLCLRLTGSQKRPPVLPVIAVVSALALLIVLWRTADGTADEQQIVTPSPSSGHSQPDGRAPDTLVPTAAPTVGP